jgi:Flp pilus assembly pilin Flp
MALSHLSFRPCCAPEEGQALVEYSLVLALITLVSVTALTAISGNLLALLNAISDLLVEVAEGL